MELKTFNSFFSLSLLVLCFLSHVVAQVSTQSGCSSCTISPTTTVTVKRFIQYRPRKTCTGWFWPFRRCSYSQVSYQVTSMVPVTRSQTCFCAVPTPTDAVDPFSSNANDSMMPNPSSNVEPGAGEIVGGVLLLLLAVALIATIVVIVVVVVVVVVVRKCKGRHKQRSTSVSGGQGIIYQRYENIKGSTRGAPISDNVLVDGDERSIQYETIPLPSNENQVDGIYQYVPSCKEREKGATKKVESDIYAAAERMYQNYRSSSEELPYKEPSAQLDQLYDDLATMQCLEIPRKFLKFGPTLGSGEFGVVCKGEWVTPHGPREVALKVSREDIPEEEKVKLLQEAAIMKQFCHPNVVRLLGTVTISDPIILVVELLKNGSLQSHLAGLPKEMTASRKKLFIKFSQQIAEGMKYLSGKGFVHRDLAARNVLLDHEYTCKISDFGLSRNLNDNTYYMVTGGKIPLKWTAPEVLFHKKFSSCSDVWSYGMTLFEIWSYGEKPFKDLSVQELVDLFSSKLNGTNDDDEQILHSPKDIPCDINALMLTCWQFDHHKRPSFNDIVSSIHSVSNS